MDKAYLILRELDPNFNKDEPCRQANVKLGKMNGAKETYGEPQSVQECQEQFANIAGTF